MLPNHQFLIHRDDLNHAQISGNKLHKLKPSIAAANKNNADVLVSFGGPFSNHLHALAYAGHIHGFKTVGIIRGELQKKLTPTLVDCETWGMSLIGVTRSVFRLCRDQIDYGSQSQAISDATNLIPELNSLRNAYLIPEGGSHQDAIASLKAAYQHVLKRQKYLEITHAVCSTGTGATVAGLSLAAPPNVKVLGIQAVAEGEATIERIRSWLNHHPSNLSILPGHLGGFAKTPDRLLSFIAEFESQRDIPLDPIYNGKALFHLQHLFDNNYFKVDDRVLVIHTGGLQGRRSLD